MKTETQIINEINYLLNTMQTVFEQYVEYTNASGRVGFDLDAYVIDYFTNDAEFFLEVMSDLERQLNVRIPFESGKELETCQTLHELFDHIYKYAYHNQSAWDAIKTRHSSEKYPC